MTRTKQGPRKSTGGKAPRKQAPRKQVVWKDDDDDEPFGFTPVFMKGTIFENPSTCKTIQG